MVHSWAKVWSFARNWVPAAERFAEVDLLDELDEVLAGV
jgi:hypothetical protein